METSEELDRSDSLRAFRDEFHLPRNAEGKPLVYFCGHSLGLQPRAAANDVEEILRDWAHYGVEGHFASRHPWVSYHERLTPGLAALAGAQAHEVVAMNSLSINLHLLLASFYRPTAERRKILIEQSAFPSDRYAVEAQLRWHGFNTNDELLEIGPRPGESTICLDDLLALIERDGTSIATILLPGVQYLTGQRLDLRSITSAGHKYGCIVGFDLAHAIGNTPLALHDDGVDFAVWCGYKYLNGGPGAIGGAFIHERHAREFDLPRLAGWWGHDKATRFAMPDRFAPLPGAEGWQVSNPPVLSMAPLIASLEIFQRAGMQRLREKSERLTLRLETHLRSRIGQKLQIITPANPLERGCQLSLAFDSDASHSDRVRRRLADSGVVCDWREPNVIRIAPVPLYNSFADVERFADILDEALA